MEEDTLGSETLAIQIAREQARQERCRVYVIRRSDDTYDTMPAPEYKRLQHREEIVAIAMPDGEVRHGG